MILTLSLSLTHTLSPSLSPSSDILTLSLSIISKQELIFPQQSTSLILVYTIIL